MKKFLYVTNIPTPYRQKRFNVLASLLEDLNYELEVLYMANIEPNRKWTIDPSSYHYKYKIYRGVHPVLFGMFAHFNPELLLRLLKNDYKYVVIGGLANPTLWLAPFFVNSSKKAIISIESNLYSVNRKSGIAYRLKEKLLNKADIYQVTGSPQKAYIEFFINKKIEIPTVVLPNIIDEEVFQNEVTELRKERAVLRKEFGVELNYQMWVLPARLIPIKGILPFLKSFRTVKDVKLVIVGDGELKMEILEYVKANSLNVVVTGHLQQAQLLRFYAASDLFVLPSLKDPSPLTPIEAIAGGLPILVSNRIGNLEDVLISGSNGWSFDPEVETDLTDLVLKISKLPESKLGLMREASRYIYKKKFDAKEVLNKYIQEIGL